MKRFTLVLFGVLVLLGAARPARAQIFGQFMGARPLAVNEHLAGAYVTASEHSLGLLGQLRLSFYPSVDFGFQGGLSRIDFGATSRTGLRLGADFKAWVLKRDESTPLDFAIGGAIGVETGDDFTVLSMGPTLVASRTVPAGQGTLTPYVGLGLLFSRLDRNTDDESDFALPVRFGADYALNPGLRITAELQVQTNDSFNDDVRFAAGVHLPF